MTIATREFDAAEYLDSEETMAEFLSAALETGDPAFIAESIGVIARAKGIAQIAEETGLGRTSLYKALRADGNPAFVTVLQVMKALGLSLQAKPARPVQNEETVGHVSRPWVTLKKAQASSLPASDDKTAKKPTSKRTTARAKRSTGTRHSKGVTA